MIAIKEELKEALPPVASRVVIAVVAFTVFAVALALFVHAYCATPPVFLDFAPTRSQVKTAYQHGPDVVVSQSVAPSSAKSTWTTMPSFVEATRDVAVSQSVAPSSANVTRIVAASQSATEAMRSIMAPSPPPTSHSREKNSSCAAAAAFAPLFVAYSDAAKRGAVAGVGAPGLHVVHGTPETDRRAMLAGSHRAAFVSVLRETQVCQVTQRVRAPLALRTPPLLVAAGAAAQAVLLRDSGRLVVVETDAGIGYVSLVGLDPAGPARGVPTSRALYRAEAALGGHRGFLQVVLVEEDPALAAAACANAALGGQRIRACTVGYDAFVRRGGADAAAPPPSSGYDACGLAGLVAPRSPSPDSQAESEAPLALLVLNRPSTGALATLRALLLDGAVGAVAADLSDAASQGGLAAWAPFVAALAEAGFSTHALVRPGGTRLLRDPEPPKGSMLVAPVVAAEIETAWAKATAFVSARKPLLHFDAECTKTVGGRGAWVVWG